MKISIYNFFFVNIGDNCHFMPLIPSLAATTLISYSKSNWEDYKICFNLKCPYVMIKYDYNDETIYLFYFEVTFK